MNKANLEEISPPNKTCNCDHCIYYQHVKNIKKHSNVKEMRKLIDDLYERYQNTDFDLDVWKAIYDGSWPSARDYAMTILENVDKYEKEHKTKTKIDDVPF